MSEELKACPFCGGEASGPMIDSVLSNPRVGNICVIQCGGCGALTHGTGPGNVASAWNRRPSPEAGFIAIPSSGECGFCMVEPLESLDSGTTLTCVDCGDRFVVMLNAGPEGEA